MPSITLRPAASHAEVDTGYAFLDAQLGLDAQHRRSVAFYHTVFTQTPGLLLLANDHQLIVGALFASIEGDHVLAGELAVVPAAQRQGIGSRLLGLLEAQSRHIGQRRIMLGAVASAEGFYLQNGYRPLLFIQVARADLQAQIQPQLPGYERIWEDLQPDRYAVIIATQGLEKALQQRINALAPEVSTQYLFVKEL